MKAGIDSDRERQAEEKTGGKVETDAQRSQRQADRGYNIYTDAIISHFR